MRILALAVAAACVGVLAGGPALGQEWTRFRGPNGSGASDATTVPAAWTEKDVRWKVALPGPGHSSPVLWGDRIFVTCGDPESAKRTLLCLKAADGSILWRRDFDSAPTKQNTANSYATPTPAVDKDRVYVLWATEQNYPAIALTHDGKDVWRRDLGPFVSQHGHGASPIVFEDLLIVPNDQDGVSFIAALDCATGKTRWQTERKSTKAAYSTPCILQREGGAAEIILSSHAHGITALDPKTGRVAWEMADAFPQRVVGSPVVAGGLVLGNCGTGGAGMHVIAVRPPAAKDGKPAVAWKAAKPAPYVTMPVVSGGLVFLWTDTGTVLCVRLATGEEVWREKLGGSYYASPVAVGGRIYNVSRTGEVVSLAAGEKYELLGRTPLGEATHATPAVAGGRMVLRTLTHLISVGGK